MAPSLISAENKVSDKKEEELAVVRNESSEKGEECLGTVEQHVQRL